MNQRDPQVEGQYGVTPASRTAGRPRSGVARSQRKSTQAFSLIELLVVVAVIGTLVSMVLPAMTGMLQSGEKKKVLMEVKTIKAAIDAYYTTYGETPMPPNMHTGWAGDWTGWDWHTYNPINALRGVHNASYPNPRKITFLQSSTGDASGIMNDPWGNSYRIRWDCTYDEKITINPNGAGNKTYNVRAIVYSHGPNGIWGGGDDIFSID